MGMSTHIVGFREADAEWNKMKTIWESCENAQVKIPDEVLEFFDHEDPEDKPGQEVDISQAVKEWQDEYGSSQGFELDVNNLPKGLTKVRFYNNY